MTKEEELHAIYMWAMEVAFCMLTQIERLKEFDGDIADLVRAIAEERIAWVNTKLTEVQP